MSLENNLWKGASINDVSPGPWRREGITIMLFWANFKGLIYVKKRLGNGVEKLGKLRNVINGSPKANLSLFSQATACLL